jgi:DNA-binding SARP family transcriptional activator
MDAKFARLRRTLHRLQQAIGDDILDSESEAICLSPGADLWLDSDAFRQEVTAGLAAQKNTNDRIVRLNAAVALYTQDFLAGFTLPNSPAFDEWQFFQRETCASSTVRRWSNWCRHIGPGRNGIRRWRMAGGGLPWIRSTSRRTGC